MIKLWHSYGIFVMLLYKIQTWCMSVVVFFALLIYNAYIRFTTKSLSLLLPFFSVSPKFMEIVRIVRIWIESQNDWHWHSWFWMDHTKAKCFFFTFAHFLLFKYLKSVAGKKTISSAYSEYFCGRLYVFRVCCFSITISMGIFNIKILYSAKIPIVRKEHLGFYPHNFHSNCIEKCIILLLNAKLLIKVGNKQFVYFTHYIFQYLFLLFDKFFRPYALSVK